MSEMNGHRDTESKLNDMFEDVSISNEDNNDLPAKKVDLNKKREEYLSWEDYFMAIAFLSAQRSKDPSTQVGACVVNPEKKIVGIGYNGMPTGCSDDVLPWSRVGETPLDTKYPFGKRSIFVFQNTRGYLPSIPVFCGYGKTLQLLAYI